MKVRDVIARAVSHEYTWLQAAEIIGVTPRTIRRWKARYERSGYDGLMDRRRGVPSPRRVPLVEVERVLCLMNFGGMPFCMVSESLTLTAREVMPRLASIT